MRLPISRNRIRPLPLNQLTDEEKLAMWPTIRYVVQKLEKNLEDSLDRFPDGYHAKFNKQLYDALEHGLIGIAKEREKKENPLRLEAFND